MRSTEADLTNSRGEAERLAKLRMKAADEQWANLMQNLDLLRATVGETLLPAVNRLIPRPADGLKSLRGWVEANRGWVKWAADAMAWGAAILIPLGAIAMLGASLAFIGSYLPVALQLFNVFKWWGAAVKVVTAAQWLLDAAMNANPIGLFIAGVALLIAGAYELRKHWGAIYGELAAIATWFGKIGTEAYNSGVNLLKNFGRGIASAVMYPVHAIEDMAGKAARFVLGHSPIPEGPLHDLNLGRDIARTIQPGPIVAAMRRVAMVTALAAPMMVGVGAPAFAARGGAASGGATIINITVTYNVTAGSPEDFVKAAKKHAEEMTKIIERRQAVHARREF